VGQGGGPRLPVQAGSAGSGLIFINPFIFNTVRGIARAQRAAAEAGSVEKGAQGWNLPRA
jgi:hypothetical protein